MSRSPDRPKRARSLRLAAAVAGLAATSAAFAPGAQAAFTTGQCAGPDVTGRGASFQKSAHAAWLTGFRFGFCGGSAPVPTFSPDGSGAGRRSVGERSGTNTTGARLADTRFAATDEPLTTIQRSQIETGLDAAGDEGKVHELPVAVGAAAIIVNFPDNCDVRSIGDANQTIPTGADATNLNRVKLSKNLLERIFYGKGTDGGDVGTWGDAFPSIKAIVGNAAGKTDAQCVAQPFVRVKRFDDSGTTFVVKDEFNTINPAHNWLTTYITPDTRTWPNCPTGSTTCIDGGANGGGSLAGKVGTTDGSIGYADLATARDNQFFKTPGTTADDTYWVPTENGTAGTFTDPAADPNSFTSSGNRGANCAQATFKNIPTTPSDPTLGDFSKTSGVNSPQGYGICTVTYELAFDDNATVYGNNASEEAKARTVRDYVSYIVNDGQGVLFGADYSPVPPAIIALSRAGAAAIGWNKAGDASTPPPPGGGGTPPPPGGGGTPPPPKPVIPSNRFTITGFGITKNGGLVLRIRVGAKGRLAISGSGRYRVGRKTKVLRSIGGISVLPRAGGTIRIGFRPSSALLKAAKKYGSVKLKLKISYTPTGGSRRVAFKTVTFKVKSRSRR